MIGTLERSEIAEPSSSVLNRLELAVALQEAGVEVDFEDWDGLSDDQVRQFTSHTGLEVRAFSGDQVILDPQRQGRIVLALIAGDRGLFERADLTGMFAKFTEEGENEI